MQKSISFNDVVIFSIKRSDYRTQFWYMSRYDVINIMKNSNLIEKKIDRYKFFLKKCILY